MENLIWRTTLRTLIGFPEPLTYLLLHRLTYAFVRHHTMGMPFANLLLAPVLNTNWLVGFYNVCNLELGIHLLEEEEAQNNILYV